MHHRARHQVEDQVHGAPGLAGVRLGRQFAPGLGAGPALQDQALLPLHDRCADALAQRGVAGGLGDHRHQAARGLRAGQDRRELQHHALDVGGQRAAVGQFELVEELRHRVHDQLVLARPATVERRLGDPGPCRDVAQGELGPAQVDQRRPRRGEDGGVRRGAARAPGTAGGGAALHAPTITGGLCVAVREITGEGCSAAPSRYYATRRSESTGAPVPQRRPPARGGDPAPNSTRPGGLSTRFSHARAVRGRIGPCSHGTCP